MRTRTYCKVVPGFHPVKPCAVTKPFGKNKFNQFLEGYIWVIFFFLEVSLDPIQTPLHSCAEPN